MSTTQELMELVAQDSKPIRNPAHIKDERLQKQRDQLAKEVKAAKGELLEEMVKAKTIIDASHVDLQSIRSRIDHVSESIGVQHAEIAKLQDLIRVREMELAALQERKLQHEKEALELVDAHGAKCDQFNKVTDINSGLNRRIISLAKRLDKLDRRLTLHRARHPMTALFPGKR